MLAVLSSAGGEQVYEKGAQVIRMYETLLGGQAAFQKGMKLYFERHDGDAVTCDDFRAAMADANGVSVTDRYCQHYLPHHVDSRQQ
jgi:aminopeptidase N